MNTVHSCPYVFNVCTKIYVYNVPYIWYGFNTCIHKTTVISVPCLSWRFFVGQILPWLLPHNSESSLPQDDVAFLNKIHKHSRKSWTRWGCDFTKFPTESRCNSGTSCWMEALQAQTELNSGGKAVRKAVCLQSIRHCTLKPQAFLLGRCICIATCFTVIGICLWEVIPAHPTAGSTSLTTWSTQAALAASGTAFSARWRSAKGNTSSKCATLVFINRKCSVKLKEQARIKRLKAKISMTSKPYLHVCPWWSTQREPWEVDEIKEHPRMKSGQNWNLRNLLVFFLFPQAQSS